MTLLLMIKWQAYKGTAVCMLEHLLSLMQLGHSDIAFHVLFEQGVRLCVKL